MNILIVLEDAIKSKGFDGLVVPGECGCLADDLSPGNCLRDLCLLGYKHTHSVTGEWIMSLSRKPVTDDAIAAIAEMCG